MSDFSKVLIKDDRLLCSPEISYAVMKGAMNHTMISYSALTGSQSVNPSSLTFNIQVPSEQIILDRRIVIENKFSVVVRKRIRTIQGQDLSAYSEPVFNNDGAFDVGNQGANIIQGADCLNAYPFHQIVNTAQITINNTAVSLNVSDVLPALIRLNDSRELNKFNGSAPIQADSDGNYGSTTAGLASTSVAVNKPNSPFSSDTNPLDEAYSPRNSFVVSKTGQNITGPAGAAPASLETTATETITFTTFEPLMVSPFTFSNPQSNGQGIYGLQNLSFNFNLGNKNRLIRSRPITVSQAFGAIPAGSAVSATEVGDFILTESKLHLIYLTPQPTDALSARNCVPYYELPRYPTNSVDVLSANWANAQSPVASPGTDIVFNAIQLNQIPDKLIVFVRHENNTAYNNNTNCADSFLPIEKININFNNQSGLLTTMTPIELFRMSRDNGSTQSWQEFSGLTNTRIGSVYNLTQNGYAYDATLPFGNTGIVGVVGRKNQNVLAPTTGSLLILQFGKDIELPDYYAPGSLGNFNLQMTITVRSYNNIVAGGVPASSKYQVLCITMNSGVFISEKGQSATYTGLLTKEDVLQASAMEAISTNDYRRLVGSGFWDNLKSIGSKAFNFVKPILGTVGKFAAQQGAQALQQSGNPYASMAGNLLGKVVGQGMSGGVEGGAMSAGAMSAGAMSAGRRRVMKHLAQ